MDGFPGIEADTPRSFLGVFLAALVLTFALANSAFAQASKVTAVGLTEPVLAATVSTPVAGIISQRKFKEGDEIKRGDVMVELDRRLEELEVVRRQAVYAQAKTELEVTKALYEKPNSSTPKVEVEKRQLEYAVAKVEFELAEEQLRRRQIIAPFDGFITELFLQVGEACQAQQPVARLVDTRRCHLVVNLEAKSGLALKVGQTVELEIESGAAPIRVAGRVSFISPVVDPASGLLKVKVAFDNPDGAVRPGIAGKMSF